MEEDGTWGEYLSKDSTHHFAHITLFYHYRAAMARNWRWPPL